MGHKIQVRQLAGELGLGVDEVLVACAREGIMVKGPTSTLQDGEADRLRQRSASAAPVAREEAESVQPAMDVVGAILGEEKLPDDLLVAAAHFLIDLQDSGHGHPFVIDQLHHLCDRTSNASLSALVDWWVVVGVGRDPNGNAWHLPDELPNETRLVMEQLRDLRPSLPDDLSVLRWLEKWRSLAGTLEELEFLISYKTGNTVVQSETPVWEELAAPFEAFRNELVAGRIADYPAPASDREVRRTAQAKKLRVGSDRFKYLSRTYAELVEVARSADETAREALAISPPADLAHQLPDVSSPEGTNSLALLSRVVLRAVLGRERTDVADLRASIAAASAAARPTHLGWLALVTYHWHQATFKNVPELDRLWAQRTHLQREIERLASTHDPEEVAGLTEQLDMTDDLATIQEMLDTLVATSRSDARRRDVEHRVQQLLEQASDSDLAEDLTRRAELVRADLADDRIDEAIAELDRMREEFAASRRSDLLDAADALVDRLEVLGAGALARDAAASVEQLRDDEAQSPDLLLEELRDRVTQVETDLDRRLHKTLADARARLTRNQQSIDASHRSAIEDALEGASLALGSRSFPQADERLREAGRLLNQYAMPAWHADDGEKALLHHVIRYLGQHATFDETDIRRFHVALKTKRFVILAGLTGTGKSTIGRLYAEALGATSANGRLTRIAVRPNWIDETEVLGFIHPTSRRFEPGWLAELVQRCQRDPDLPVFCILDEMNLAPVEHYLADVLSAMEDAATPGSPAMLRLYSPSQMPTNQDDWPASVAFPDNLFLVGTVNVDESTRPLSDRVIDRANLIQLSSDVNADHHNGTTGPVELQEPAWRVAMGDWEAICADEPFDGHHEFLISVGQVMRSMRIGLGMRAHLEIERFCANAAEVLTEEEALDLALLQRVIPKVRGFRSDLQSGLEDLQEEFRSVDAVLCTAVCEEWLDSGRGDDTYVDGTSSLVGLVAHA